MDPRGDLGNAVCGVRYLGSLGRLGKPWLAGVAAADRGRLHHQIYQLLVVAEVQRHQARIVHSVQLDRRDRVCVSGGVFHQSVYLPELPDSEFESGEESACGRFSVRKQDGVRCESTADAAEYAVGATHDAGMVRRREELFRLAALGVQETQRLDES